jgi:hypothetical protein
MGRNALWQRSILAFRPVLLASAAILCLCGGWPRADAAPTPRNGRPGAANRNDDKSAESHTTKLKLRVLTDDGKPVGNASVYVRFYTGGGILHHEKLAELDLKTNQDGSVKVPPIPQGKTLIQVIAPGWHTFGKWYDLEKDEQLIEIKLEPPPHWY